MKKSLSERLRWPASDICVVTCTHKPCAWCRWAFSWAWPWTPPRRSSRRRRRFPFFRKWRPGDDRSRCERQPRRWSRLASSLGRLASLLPRFQGCLELVQDWPAGRWIPLPDCCGTRRVSSAAAAVESRRLHRNQGKIVRRVRANSKPFSGTATGSGTTTTTTTTTATTQHAAETEATTNDPFTIMLRHLPSPATFTFVYICVCVCVSAGTTTGAQINHT